jgi:hypothetical protein
MVPVNLRAPSDGGIPTTATISATASAWSRWSCRLASKTRSPGCMRSRARMAALKGSYQALLTFALLGATGMAPSFVEEQVLKVLASKTTAVMTNVPARSRRAILPAPKIDQQTGLGPAGRRHRHGRQRPLLRRPGAIWPDSPTRRLVDDPQSIVDRFADEFEKLLWLVLLEPVDRLADPDAVAEDLARSAPGQSAPPRPRGMAAARSQSASSARAASTSSRSIASMARSPQLPDRGVRRPSFSPCQTSSPEHSHTRYG